jgi:hypothetical protein
LNVGTGHGFEVTSLYGTGDVDMSHHFFQIERQEMQEQMELRFPEK